MPVAFINHQVRLVRRSLVLTSVLLVVSIVFVMRAFATAGFASAPPSVEYTKNIGVTTAIGGALCLGLLLWFMKKLCHIRPMWWRQMEEMSVCSHAQDPQRIQPVTGQAHTRRVERGVAAMERAVRQRSSGTMEGCRRCCMLPRGPPWPLHARSSSSKKLKGVTALCLPRHMLLGAVGADPCCLPVAVGPRGGCFERWRTGYGGSLAGLHRFQKALRRGDAPGRMSGGASLDPIAQRAGVRFHDLGIGFGQIAFGLHLRRRQGVLLTTAAGVWRQTMELRAAVEMLLPAQERAAACHLPRAACCSARLSWHIRSSVQQLHLARFGALHEPRRRHAHPCAEPANGRPPCLTSTYISSDRSQSAQYTFTQRARGEPHHRGLSRPRAICTHSVRCDAMP